MKRLGMLIIVMALLAAAGMGNAAPVNPLIPFVKDTALTPGAYTLRFSLWNVSTGGTEATNMIWWEQKNITLTSGTVTTNLGSVTDPTRRSDAISNIDFSQQYWVKVETVTAGAPPTYTEVGTRTRMNAVPYAMYSLEGGSVTSVTAGVGLEGNATTGDITMSVPAGGITGAMLATGSVGTGKIANGAVTDAKITGPISAAKISPTGLNADTVDGKHAADFAAASHNHDAAYINASGDTMTGALTLPADGLFVPKQFMLVNGNVGVAERYPSRKLHVREDIAGLSFPLKLDNQDSTINSASTGILFSTGGGGNLRGKGGLIYQTTDTYNRGSFHFLQQSKATVDTPLMSDSVMTITNSGNVGIGITNPASRLEVNGMFRVKNFAWPTSGKSMEMAYDSTTNTGYIQVYDREASSNNWGKLYLGNGNVGIGTATPTEKLEVNGNVKVQSNIEATGQIKAHNSYGDSIALGGDATNNDLEVNISAPQERNNISFWNTQTGTGANIGANNINAQGNITKTYSPGANMSAIPYAYGTFNPDCTRINGTFNTSCTKMGTGRFYIKVNGITNVAIETTILVSTSPTVTWSALLSTWDIKPKFATYAVTSSDGIEIDINDHTYALSDEMFSFVVYKP